MAMNPEQERELFRRQLEEDLGELRFARTTEVLKRTHPRTWHARLDSLWNKEIELPLFPLGMSLALLVTIATVAQWKNSDTDEDASGEQRQLIQAGGNTYWKDDYEKAVAASEVDHKS